jgi:GGDEF domain-containing protein
MAGSFQSTDKTNASDEITNKRFDSADSIGLEKLELMTILQSTLNLNSVLKYFLENLRKKLRIDGLCFIEEDRQLKIRIGRQSTHSCGYHLTKEDTACGELIFKRSTRFSEQDLEVIEEAILLLLVPISNTLKYQDAVAKSSFNPMREVIERKTLMSTLNREVELAKRHNHPLSLLSLKVMLNTKVKDLQDERLQPLCQSFHAASNSTDMWFRISTSEFLLLTHNALEDATKIGWEFQQLENRIPDRDFSTENISIKVGVAALTGTDSVNSLIKRSQQPEKFAAASLV